MAELKTKATQVSVDGYIAAIASEERRADCYTLVQMMQRITGCPAVMWGTSIIGFDKYSYRYGSGHSGEMCIAGFASRKPDLVIYAFCGDIQSQALLDQLGKHKVSKACLYVKRLSDIDLGVLEQIVQRSIDDTKQKYPASVK
jgi:hypothetical protein